ncbi:MAG: AraC family transcriptional regulator [Spirochaetes bacterium]|nr:MAG: AraC family transcriptional regulator [Spirochaetota bacterium]
MVITYTPSPRLAEFVSCFWALSSLDAAHSELVYPTGRIQVIFHYGDPFIDTLPSGSALIHPRFALCGQKTSYSHVSAGGSCGMIGAVLHTHAAFRVLGLPVHEITDLTVGLAEVVCEWSDLEEEFLDCVDDPSRIAVIEKFILLKTAGDACCGDYFVRSCVDEIEHSRGTTVPHKSLERFDLSKRSMQRIFRERTGLSPKKYAEIVRFEHCIALLGRHRDTTTAALEAGFYDQSHCIREFRRLCGLTPLEFSRAM